MTDDIVLDPSSGISVEEQQEILSQINGITEKNRRSLSALPVESSGEYKKIIINAKKKGVFFPVIVNIAALLILAAGGFLILFFNSRKDVSIREGSGVYTDTERVLIEEIRRETAMQLAAKEDEIASIASRLADVDAQLMQLYSGNQELTSEQLALEEMLLASQESFRANLLALQEDRARILEDSRARESRFRALLEERSKEFAAAQKITESELDSAREELARLSSEQERMAAIDAQIAGALYNVSGLVEAGEYNQAQRVIQELRNFLEAGAANDLGASRSFRMRRDIYNQAISSMEATISEMIMFRDINSESVALYERSVQMEETISDLQRRLDVLGAGSSGQAQRLNELEETVSSLRSANAALTSSLETTITEKDNTIQSLEAERTGLLQTVTTRDTLINELQAANTANEQEIVNLRNQIDVIRQLLLE